MRVILLTLFCVLATGVAEFPVLPGPIKLPKPLNLDVMGYSLDLANIVLTELELGEWTPKYSEPKIGAGPLKLVFSKVGTNLATDFTLVSATNKSAHAEGVMSMVLQNSEIEFILNIDVKDGLPNVAALTKCNLSIATLNAKFTDKPSSTIHVAEFVANLVKTFGGWAAVDAMLGPILAPKVCAKMGDIVNNTITASLQNLNK
jgi:hypothetical protein